MITAVPQPSGDVLLPLRVPTDVILVERLLHTPTPDLDLPTIAEVINRSRADLAGVPAGAMPELLERLVRQRLSQPVTRTSRA